MDPQRQWDFQITELVLLDDISGQRENTDRKILLNWEANSILGSKLSLFYLCIFISQKKSNHKFCVEPTISK